jgi:integrase
MDLYNDKMKNDYLNKANKSYEKSTLAIFRASCGLEQKYNKDLYEFTIEELKELMGKLNIKTNASARNRYGMISHYITYNLRLGRVKENPLFKEDSRWYEQFVDSNRKIISEDELEGYLLHIKNAQDKVVYRLIFEGIMGKDFSELLNLKKDDIFWDTNTVNVVDSATGPRNVKVSDKCMVLLKEAIEQTDPFGDKGNRYQRKYIDSDYVIKNRGWNAKTRTGQIIQTKIKLLKEVSKNNDMTAYVIRYSGMARRVIDVSRKLNIPVRKMKFGKQWREVAIQFNEKPTNNNGTENYANIRLNLKDHLDVIHELYGEFEEYKIEKFVLVPENDVEQNFVNHPNIEVETEYSIVPESEGEYEYVKRKRRIGHPQYKEFTILAYNNRCAVTGEKFPNILEACHIQPYINEKSNHIQNSILLRADIHKLFDDGYLTIDEKYIVKISPSLNSEYYQSFHGKKIYLPSDPTFHPSIEALNYISKDFRE